MSRSEENLKYIKGSSKSLIINYKIENLGEPAYLTQLNISIPDSVSFLKIPSACSQPSDNSNSFLCDINSGGPIYSNRAAFFNLTVDTTNLQGNELQIKAHALSKEHENIETDSQKSDVIALTDFSNIDVLGFVYLSNLILTKYNAINAYRESTKLVLSLEDGDRVENIRHIFEIQNRGPSTINNLDVLLSIPVSFLNTDNQQLIDFIDISNVTVKVSFSFSSSCVLSIIP